MTLWGRGLLPMRRNRNDLNVPADRTTPDEPSIERALFELPSRAGEILPHGRYCAGRIYIAPTGEQDKTMKWSAPMYEDRSIYNKAGKTLLKEGVSTEDLNSALEIVGDWRAAHRYPLHAIMMTLRTRARHTDSSAIVVQRSKRIVSIIPKLERMRLTQIQDIGGCRAILKDLSRLNKVHRSYMDRAAKPDPRRSYMEGEPDNYIDKPKADGYRSIHYVFRYRSELEEYKPFEGMKIEVQLRTRVQHSWATALEIVDLFNPAQKLKTDIDKNQADPQWKRFFKLMGTVIARREECADVPDTPSTQKELVKELRDLCNDLNIITKLEGYGKAVNHLESKKSSKGGAVVVVLNTKERTLRTILFTRLSKKQIDEEYLRFETAYLNMPHMQVVQVNVESLDQLKRAYPNYDLDTKEFVSIVKQALGLL